MRRRRIVLLACVLVAGIAATYHDALRAPFIFDDEDIVDNLAQHRRSASEVMIGSTRPLVQLSFAANHAVGNLDVRGYHLVNVAIHVLGALLLFGIARRSIPVGGDPEGVAFAITLLWAVHPLQTESVTYVSQRAESLAGCFALATLYCVVRGAQASGGARWYSAAVVACLLGMASKPVMVATPLVVLFYDRAFLAGSWRLAWRRRRALHCSLAATCGVLVVLLAQHNESEATAGFSIPGVSVAEFARSQPGVVLHYLRLAVWPWPLVLDYDWPVARDAGAILLPAVAIATLLAVAARTFRRRPQLGFLGLAFFLLIAPSSSVIPIKDLAAEHRMYLPLAPLVALAVLGTAWLVRATGASAAIRRAFSQALVVAAAVALSALTLHRNAEYRDPIGMWRDVAARIPTNARAHNNLSHLLLDAGRVAEAAPHAARAVELDPRYPHARNNLGAVLRAQGKLDAAIVQFDEALRLDPDYADAYNNRGLARAGLGRFDDAIADYGRALEGRPYSAEVHGNLGSAFLGRGSVSEAVREYGIALRLAPDRAEMHFNLALALFAQGNVVEARAHQAEALRLKPELAALMKGGAPR